MSAELVELLKKADERVASTESRAQDAEIRLQNLTLEHQDLKLAYQRSLDSLNARSMWHDFSNVIDSVLGEANGIFAIVVLAATFVGGYAIVHHINSPVMPPPPPAPPMCSIIHEQKLVLDSDGRKVTKPNGTEYQTRQVISLNHTGGGFANYTIGEYETVDAAAEQAKRLGCEVK